MAINLFKPKYANKVGILKDLSKIMDIGWTGLGGKTVEFEKAFAEQMKVKYAVGVNSATSALHLALTVAGVGAGDGGVRIHEGNRPFPGAGEPV